MSEACLHMNPLAQPGGFPYGRLLRARAPRMLVTASAQRGPVRTALGGVTGSHRRPSERAPRTVAPFRRWGARRAVRSRGEGVCPGAAAIDGAPPVCPGPRGARLLCVWPLSSPQQRRQPRHQERGLSFLSAPHPGCTGRTSVPGPCACGASAAFSAPHGGPMAPHFQGREQDRGPLRASVLHPHVGAMGAPAPGSHGDQMWRPLCVPGPARGACSAPATRHGHSQLPGGGAGAQQTAPASCPLPSGSSRSPSVSCPSLPALGGSSRSTAPAPRPGRVLSVIWASPADPRHLFCPHPRLSVMQGVAGPFPVVITPARQETEAGGERGPGWLRGGASLTCVVAAGGPTPCLLLLVLRQPSQGSCLLLDGRSGGRGLAAPGVRPGCSRLLSASRPPP